MPKNAFEDVGECGAKVRAEAVRACAIALLESGMAEAVIRRALVAVLQDVIGLADFLELVFGGLVARIAVRMPLHRELAIRRLDLGIGRGARDAECFIVAGLGHRAFSSQTVVKRTARHIRALSPPPLAGEG
jgi:hypothetical protein